MCHDPDHDPECQAQSLAGSTDCICQFKDFWRGKTVFTLEITYPDGRTEVIDHPVSTVLADLAKRFAAESVAILAYKPSE